MSRICLGLLTVQKLRNMQMTHHKRNTAFSFGNIFASNNKVNTDPNGLKQFSNNHNSKHNCAKSGDSVFGNKSRIEKVKRTFVPQILSTNLGIYVDASRTYHISI